VQTVRGPYLLNSLASGRRLALRVVVWQIAAGVLAGIFFLILGWREALAAVLGAGVVAAGTALLSLRAFALLGSGELALARLLAGIILKWMTIGGGLMLILVQFKLPPLATITGLVAAYAVNMLAFRFKG